MLCLFSEQSRAPNPGYIRTGNQSARLHFSLAPIDTIKAVKRIFGGQTTKLNGVFAGRGPLL
jgi:hypothetical protein